ncbi:MAG: alpha/beta hydrolase [Hyphomonadaceae bacterium]
MALDPRFQALLDRFPRPHVDWKAGAAHARLQFWKTIQALEADAPPVREIRNLEIDGAAGKLKARLYEPIAAGVGPGPALVYFHGGGFVLGDLESHEMLCRRLAANGAVRVLSVAYRLAPEHKFPCAYDDALAATRYAFTHTGDLGFDPARIAIGGDSAGGNLAAGVAQALKREPQRPKAQLLIYPCVQLIQMTPSQIRLREGLVLTQAAQDFFKEKYLARKEDAFDVRCSPLLENDLASLPPAYIVTAGLDPLRDEGKAYADKLAACGVSLTLADYPAQVHGFFNMTAVSAGAREAVEVAARWLAAALARPR